MQIPFQINVFDGQILGMLHIPDKRENVLPVIIMCYGLNGDRIDNHRLAVLAARQAEKKGIAFVRFDYRGCGISTGEFFDTTLNTKLDDALAVVRFIKGCIHSEEYKIILLGYSDGARIVSQLANIDNDISALCMWNPIFKSMTENFQKNKSNRINREPHTKKMVFTLFGLWIGCDYVRQANENVGIEQFYKFEGDKLIVFGNSDKYTTTIRNELMNIKTQYKNFDIQLIDNANHLFNKVVWVNQLINNTLDWIIKLK